MQFNFLFIHFAIFLTRFLVTSSVTMEKILSFSDFTEFKLIKKFLYLLDIPYFMTQHVIVKTF